MNNETSETSIRYLVSTSSNSAFISSIHVSIFDTSSGVSNKLVLPCLSVRVPLARLSTAEADMRCSRVLLTPGTEADAKVSYESITSCQCLGL